MSRMTRISRLTSLLNGAQRNYGTDRKSNNYYEILGITQDASKKDIRLAFIKLSKEAHPDTSSKNDRISHDEFVKINEAYNVLSKDQTRRKYDIDLQYGENPYASTFRRPNETVYYYRDSTWHDIRGPQSRRRHEGYYRERDQYRDYRGRIIIICIFIFLSGGAIQMLAIMFGNARQHARIMRDSERLSREYDAIRERARVGLMNKSGLIDIIETKLAEDNIERDEAEKSR